MKKIYVMLTLVCALYTGMAQQNPGGLKLQSKAPDVEAMDHSGKAVSLAALRKSGPVILIFYRGYWCPYCNKQLKELQDSLQFITNKGASVIAISPEAPAGETQTIEKTGASFPIIFDKDVTISKAYNVAYEIDSATMTKYKNKWGVDFLKINEQKDQAFLPIPAVYIINREGLITYRFIDGDITKRASVKEIIANLN